MKLRDSRSLKQPELMIIPMIDISAGVFYA